MSTTFLSCVTRPHLSGFCAILRYVAQGGALIKTEQFYADTREHAERQALERLDEVQGASREAAAC